jgi:hypothetical protein
VPPRLQAVFYRADDGSEPVDDFIESLDDPAKQATIDNQIDRLNLLTPSSPHLHGRRGAPTSSPSGTRCALKALDALIKIGKLPG